MRTIKKVLAGGAAAAALTLGTLALDVEPASATIWWDAPPTCFDGAQWHMSSNGAGGQVMGLYTHAGQYERQIQYGGGVETQYIWVYEVSVPSYPTGMITAGRAEKLCGAEFHPYTA